MLSPFSHLDAAIAGVCLTCHDAGRPEGCRRCARREPVVSVVAGEERAPSLLKRPWDLALVAYPRREPSRDFYVVDYRDAFATGAAADRSHLCSLLDGIRSAHSAGGELDPVGYAAEVMGLVARMGRDG